MGPVSVSPETRLSEEKAQNAISSAVEGTRQTHHAARGFLKLTIARLLDLLLHPRRFMAVRRALAPTRLAMAYPRTPFKYLGVHLARSLSVADRAAILAHHYSHLNLRVAAPSLSKLLFDTLPLWHTCRQSVDFDICLRLSQPDDREGELSLTFHADSTNVFVLSFTICPGKVFGIAAEQVLLVSRLQGRKRCFEQIKGICKLLDDISPAAMLIAALAGIAHALDIQHMVGISADNQVARTPAKSLYDDFWTTLGARPLHGHFFHVALPLPEKPLNRIKQHHRARTANKRRFKKQITDHVCGEFRRHLARQS
jgi:uncharacterized protein VirK/YbjX